MTCYLYKKDESGDIVKEECMAHDVANMLNHGYKSLPDDFLADGPDVSVELGKDAEFTNDEIRELAKDEGIEKWDTARISTLKRELGYGD